MICLHYYVSDSLGMVYYLYWYCDLVMYCIMECLLWLCWLQLWCPMSDIKGLYIPPCNITIHFLYNIVYINTCYSSLITIKGHLKGSCSIILYISCMYTVTVVYVSCIAVCLHYCALTIIHVQISYIYPTSWIHCMTWQWFLVVDEIIICLHN